MGGHQLATPITEQVACGGRVWGMCPRERRVRVRAEGEKTRVGREGVIRG